MLLKGSHQSTAQRALPRKWGGPRAPIASRSTRLVSSRPSSGGVTDAQLAGEASAAAPVTPAATAEALVQRVLADTQGSDGGIAIPADVRARIDSTLDELEALGAQQQPRPLDNPLLWGNYEVRYTSIARASAAQQRGQPAGGRFRSRTGRVLFRTTGVYQSVLRPDIATNKVAFKLFGVIPGYVGLRGRIDPVGDTGDTVKVFFDRPVLSFGGCLNLRIGPPSAVQLSTTYLDGRVRLGKGSRGSLFVFERTAAADAAAMDQVGLERTTPAGMALLTAILGAMALGGCSLFATGAPALQLSGALLWLLTIGLALVFRQGGIVEDEEDKRLRKEAEARAAAAAAATGTGQQPPGSGAAAAA